MANGLCATNEVCNSQSGIETVEVRVRGQNDCTLEHCLQFCVYRLRTVRFPTRHGTNNLFKFEYVATVTRERPTNGIHTDRTTPVSISNLCQFSLSKLEFPPTLNIHFSGKSLWLLDGKSTVSYIIRTVRYRYGTVTLIKVRQKVR